MSVPPTKRRLIGALNVKKCARADSLGVLHAVEFLVECAFAVLLDRFFELEIIGYGADGQPEWRRTAFGHSFAYSVVYVDVLYYVLCFAVPLGGLAFMNWRIIVGYRAARRRRGRILTSIPMTTRMTDGDHTRRSRASDRHKARTGEHERALTLVMITIVVVFIACQSPAQLSITGQACPARLEL